MLADYQFAYNGIKVRIDRSKLDGLKALKGVTGVRGAAAVKPDNVKGVQLIGAPAVWGGLAALHGENIKIAVIDTGIDYTHANFGGPGTVAAFQAADAVDTLPPIAAVRVGHCASRAAPTSSATTTTPTRTRPTSSRSRIRTRTRSTATATARTSPAPPAGSGVTANGHDLHRPLQRRPRSPATAGRSAPASPRRPTSTASASSGAKARPTSPSTRSSGRSSTTWT